VEELPFSSPSNEVVEERPFSNPSNEVVEERPFSTPNETVEGETVEERPFRAACRIKTHSGFSPGAPHPLEVR
jgi:hypothetical protein